MSPAFTLSRVPPRVVDERPEPDVRQVVEDLERLVVQCLTARYVEIAADGAQYRLAEQRRARRTLADLAGRHAEGDACRRVLRVHSGGSHDQVGRHVGDLHRPLGRPLGHRRPDLLEAEAPLLHERLVVQAFLNEARGSSRAPGHRRFAGAGPGGGWRCRPTSCAGPAPRCSRRRRSSIARPRAGPAGSRPHSRATVQSIFAAFNSLART